MLNYVFKRFLRVIIDMYQGLRICFLMCVNTISLIPWYSLWISRTSFIFKAIMYARKAHRNFYHLSEPLHIYLPALLHLYLSYWCCRDWLTHFSQEHHEICCYAQRIILIGYHIFMYINFPLKSCLLRGMTLVERKRERRWKVSTHMPLARHDAIIAYMAYLDRFLLTCLLRGMTIWRRKRTWCTGFLLTCLLRGMTLFEEEVKQLACFYSHASCEAWPCTSSGYIQAVFVSTHMPLARHDELPRMTSL